MRFVFEIEFHDQLKCLLCHAGQDHGTCEEAGLSTLNPGLKLQLVMISAYLVKTGSCDWMTWTLMMTRSRVLMMRTMSFSRVWRTA